MHVVTEAKPPVPTVHVDPRRITLAKLRFMGEDPSPQKEETRMTPTDVQKHIMGGLVPPEDVTALGGRFAQYEVNLAEQLGLREDEEVLGDAPADDPLKAVDWYYYDRGLILYRQAYRTGDTALISRANNAVTKYRNARDGVWDYPLNWSFARGMAMHWLETSNTKTLAALQRMTQSCYNPYYLNYLAGETPDRDNPEGTDNRMQAYLLTHFTVMHALGQFDVPNPWEDTRTTTEMAHVALDKILMSQGADGNFADKTKQKSPFMTGLLLESLILYWNLVEEDDRIPGAIERSLDFMWENYLYPSGDTFYYDLGYYQISEEEGNAPTYDLNLLVCPASAWADAWSIEDCDKIFNAGVASGGHEGDGKHFNQQYFIGMLYSGWRVDNDGIDTGGGTDPAPEPGEFSLGDRVRFAGPPRFEGVISGLFSQLDGDEAAVVEATMPEFAGSQRICLLDKLEKLP